MRDIRKPQHTMLSAVGSERPGGPRAGEQGHCSRAAGRLTEWRFLMSSRKASRLGIALTLGSSLMMLACGQLTPTEPLTNTSAFGVASTVTAAGPERADVMNQGGGGVYATDGATVVRQANGLRVSVTMQTPTPGSYAYPAGTVEGKPEVFTLWAFVFNYPDLCSPPGCGRDDLGDTPAKGGVYNPAGHAVGGGTLNLAGEIRVGQPAGAPPDIPNPQPLMSPSTAQIHLAVAPHGALDPSTLPGEFRSPAGNPGFWWTGIID